jgi:hypothetical protein
MNVQITLGVLVLSVVEFGGPNASDNRYPRKKPTEQRITEVHLMLGKMKKPAVAGDSQYVF